MNLPNALSNVGGYDNFSVKIKFTRQKEQYERITTDVDEFQVNDTLRGELPGRLHVIVPLKPGNNLTLS